MGSPGTPRRSGCTCKVPQNRCHTAYAVVEEAWRWSDWWVCSAPITAERKLGGSVSEIHEVT